MRAASAGTIALLNAGRQVLLADYYTITLSTGSVLRYTSADVDLLAADGTGFVFSSTGPVISRGPIKTEVGVKVSKCALTLHADPSKLILNVPWPQFAERGGLDGATVLIQRCYMAAWGDLSNGAVILFSGRVSDVKPSRTRVDCELSSDVELLDMNMPRRIYQPACTRALYDGGCRINKSDYTATGTVGAGSTISTLIIVDGAAPMRNTSNFYDLGSITMLTGVNAGASRTIANHVGNSNTLILYPPLPVVAGIGDQVSIIPGCDKTQNQCSAKFNNLAQFGGFPYVPAPETAL